MAAASALAVPLAGTALSHDGTISTVAGDGTSGFSGDTGPAIAAQLQDPQDVAPLDGGGFLVADTDNHVIRKVDALGFITTVAGTGADGNTGDGGPATAADIGDVSSVSPTSDGGFLIADPDGHVVRKVSALGVIDTIAGSGAGSYDGDGVLATDAGLDEPTDAVELPDGSILIADHGDNRIRKVAPDGMISTVAGTGISGFSGDTGPAVTAQIDDPSDISALEDCAFLFVDEANHRIRRVDADGTITTVAGVGSSGPLGDGGPATAAYVRPSGVTALADGGFLIADESDNRVRRVDPWGTITTDAGTGSAGSAGDGGMPDVAELDGPSDVTVSPEGGYYIADSGNHKIRFVWTYDLPAGTDITPPDEPEIERGPGKLGNDPTPTWKFTAEDGAVTDCKLKRGSTVVYGWERCTSPKTYAIGHLPDGVYTFYVDAGDAAGNWSSAATDDYKLDQTPPAAPVIHEAPVARGSDLTPTFAFSGEAGATFKCELTRNGAAIADTKPCPSPMTYDLVAHGAGTYGFSVKAVDAAGNQSAPAQAGFVVDLRGLQVHDAPKPKLGKTVVASAAKGTAMMKLPGSDRWVELDAATGMPVGTRIDARRGVARLSVALGRAGRTQSARFAGGVFEVRQRKGGHGMTDIILRGRPLACGTRTGRPAAAAAAKRGRRLWGRDGGGKWRTHGQNSVATVRGTKWLTEDRCGGTLTRVTEGAVMVRNRRTGRRVLVKAGRSYIARAPRR
jgi:NHL repeat